MCGCVRLVASVLAWLCVTVCVWLILCVIDCDCVIGCDGCVVCAHVVFGMLWWCCVLCWMLRCVSVLEWLRSCCMCASVCGLV